MYQNPALTGVEGRSAPLVPMLFPVLGAHVSGAEFQYPDLTWKELCGQMANLVAECGVRRGNFYTLKGF